MCCVCLSKKLKLLIGGEENNIVGSLKGYSQGTWEPGSHEMFEISIKQD